MRYRQVQQFGGVSWFVGPRLNGTGIRLYPSDVLSLTARVERTIERRSLLRSGERVLVAVSGGLDSMVLLRVLHDLSKARSWHLLVAHFDHQLRAGASRADARFVGRTARALDLEFIHASGDVAGHARDARVSLEMAARVLRHRFLATAARAAKVTAIALAHHAGDQVELFFLRLFRGASVEGLAGMDLEGTSPEDHEIRLIRPLLEERREDLAQFASEHRIRFREDSSNHRLDILRNRIRHSLLPMLRRRYQAALDTVVIRTMTMLRDTGELVTLETEAWRRASRKPPFASLRPAVQRQIISLQLRELRTPISWDLVERLRLNQDRRVSTGVDRFLKRTKAGRILLSTAPAFGTDEIALGLEGRGGEVTFHGLHLTWRIMKLGTSARSRLRSQKEIEVYDADKVGTAIVIRNWRRGDRFQPCGMPRPVKLQDLFVNHHIPKEARHRLAIGTTAAGQIFWVEGLRIAEGFKLDKGSRRGLKWGWRRRSA